MSERWTRRPFRSMSDRMEVVCCRSHRGACEAVRGLGPGGVRRVSRRRSLGGEGAECKSADGSDAPRKERATASTGTFAIPRSWLPPANVPQTEHQHRMTIVTTRAQGNFDMAALPVT